MFSTFCVNELRLMNAQLDGHPILFSTVRYLFPVQHLPALPVAGLVNSL